MEEVKVVIPSHKRADRIQTKHVVANAIICVPDSQKAEYMEYNSENEIITHPDSVKGLTLKRQWIYEHFGDVMMLDDDITAFRRLYTSSNYLVKNKREVWEIIQTTAQNARQAGVFLFGFNKNPSPMAYRSHKPISLTGYVTGCATGLLKGSKLYYDGRINCNEDFWISALNAHYHRMIWKDNRFTFIQKDTFVNPGGLSEFRNMEAERQDFEYLKSKFGDIIQLKKENGQRKKMHPYEKTLTLPF